MGGAAYQKLYRAFAANKSACWPNELRTEVTVNWSHTIALSASPLLSWTLSIMLTHALGPDIVLGFLALSGTLRVVVLVCCNRSTTCVESTLLVTLLARCQYLLAWVGNPRRVDEYSFLTEEIVADTWTPYAKTWTLEVVYDIYCLTKRRATTTLSFGMCLNFQALSEVEGIVDVSHVTHLNQSYRKRLTNSLSSRHCAWVRFRGLPRSRICSSVDKDSCLIWKNS